MSCHCACLKGNEIKVIMTPGGEGGLSSVVHDETLTGAGTNNNPLGVDTTEIATKDDLDDKQDTLVSGTNIKTINNQSLLGSGNLEIGGSGGTSDYTELTNKPQIAGTTLVGNKTLNDLGIQPAGNYALESDIPTKTSDLTNDSGFITEYTETDPTVPSYVKNISQANITSWNNKSDFSGDYNDLTNKPTIPDVSNFITKDVNDLTYYTTTADLSNVALSGSYNDLTNTPDLTVYATTTELGNETTARENADVNLQGQIDAITSSSDVKDIVGTYTELENYDTSTLGNDDIIKVLQDSTHNNAMTYYRWVIASGFGEWEYIGQEGPYYTKSETDTLLNAKQNEIDTTHKLSSDLVDDTNNTNLFVTSAEKTAWDNKQDALTAGANITISSGTISATDTTYSDATTTTSGLMSASDKTKLNGIATGAEVNVQANWNETDTSSDSYIQNKPTIPTVPTNVSAFTNDVGYLTQHQDISGKANKISVVQTSASTIEINPNTFYKFGEVASLNITLASITDNTIYNEYMFEFVSGTTATTLTLPSSIKWLETPTIDANKIYQCSIVDNVGLLVGVANV